MKVNLDVKYKLLFMYILLH